MLATLVKTLYRPLAGSPYDGHGEAPLDRKGYLFQALWYKRKVGLSRDKGYERGGESVI